LRRKNEEEIHALRHENEEMREMLHHYQPSLSEQESTRQTVVNETEARGSMRPSVTHETEAVQCTKGTPRHPFVDRIMEVELPFRWKGLTFEPYDGTTDPDEHVSIFSTQVTLYSNHDAVFCRIFPTSLKGAALSWFSYLPPNSITDFDMLVDKFNTRFATSRPHHIGSIALINVRQEKGESLRTFMERFGKLNLRIKNLDPNVALHHLITALRPGPFADSLCKKPTLDLDELRARAAKFMQLEELREFRNQAQIGENAEKGKGKEKNNAHQFKQREHKPPKFAYYTPLNANRGRILEEALSADLIPSLQRLPTPPNANTNKHCRYHQNYGHNTDECWALKDKIEELIQAGHLRRFVRNTITRSPPRSPRGRSPRRSPRNRGQRQRTDRSRSPRWQDRRVTPVRRVINTIAEGFAGGGPSASGRKKHLRNIQAVHHVYTRMARSMSPITFTDRDFKAIDPKQDDPMVITVTIDEFAVMKTLVDQGSSVDILYWKTFKKLRIPDTEIQPYDDQIVGFSGERVDTRGFIDLYTKFGESGHQSRVVKVRYLLIDANTSCNILLGRPSLNQLGAIVSTPHLVMKFPSSEGDIITVHGDQKTARKCYAASLKLESKRPETGKCKKRTKGEEGTQSVNVIDLDPRIDHARVEPGEDVIHIELKDKEHGTKLGISLGEKEVEMIKQVLVQNVDMFAWTAGDMSGVDPEVMYHRLSVHREARPVAQKKRKQGEEKREAAKKEVAKLMATNFIKEAKYTTWLANVVMVKKANDKWRMCTDYTDLNKAYPKEAYPLPSIDRLVDGAAGHKILSFLDAYSGYNQIRMHSRDREKTAFMTEEANFYYEVMPFGLKNVGATY